MIYIPRRCKPVCLAVKRKSLMKKQMFASLLLGTCFALTGSNVSFAGADGSGGGAQIAAAFRLRAEGLLMRIEATPAANALCSAELARKALGSTAVRVVDRLIDPTTHKPITDQKLDAWTVPGDIQLRFHSWDWLFNPYSGTDVTATDVLILHEVYRATAGECIDDNFEISQRIPAMLLKTPTPMPQAYGHMYKLAYPVLTWVESTRFGADQIQDGTKVKYVQGRPEFTGNRVMIYCDANPTQKGQVVICLEHLTGSIEDWFDTTYDNDLWSPTVLFRLTYVGMKNGLSNVDLGGAKRSAATFIVNKRQVVGFSKSSPRAAVMKEISPELPFYVYFDLETGKLQAGFDPLRLVY